MSDTLTMQEVCEELKISYPTLLKLVNDGKIEAIRIGRMRRITKQALNKFKGETGE